MLRVLILSNCQSMPLSAIWKVMRPADLVAGYEVHTLIDKPTLYDEVLRRMAVADIIIHIPVADDYPVELARGSFIRSLSNVTKLCVPMVYFDGLQPDITYLGDRLHRFHSPMGDYHSRIVVAAALTGRDPDEALRRFEDWATYEALSYFDKFEESLAELRRRDLTCDFPSADIVANLVRETPSFFTINHPMNSIMREITVRIFQTLKLSYNDVSSDYLPATLAGGPVWPPVEAIRKFHGLKYPVGRFLRTDYNGRRTLQYDEFVYGSYNVYSQRLDDVAAMPQIASLVSQLGEECTSFLADRRRSGRSVFWSSEPAALDAFDAIIQREVPKYVVTQANIDGNNGDQEAAKRGHMTALWLEPENDAYLVGVEPYGFGALQTHNGQRRLRDALASDPTNFQLCRGLVESLIDVGSHEDAATIAENFVAAVPESPDAKHLLALALWRTGKLARAILAMDAAIRGAPDVGAYHERLAHILMDARQPNLAIAAIERAIALGGSNADNYGLKAYALRAMGHLRESAAWYRIAVDNRPEESSFLFGLAETLAELGAWQEVAITCSQIAQITHDDARTKALCARARQELDRVY